jgi:N-dimethylarginine dimethylaminohydrolase
MSNDEWGNLKEVIVGTATNARLPSRCSVFRKLEEQTAWKETAVPSGAFPAAVIDEANEDLETFSNTLTSLGITVHRPTDLDFENFDGMYNYCPRDRVLVVGDTIIDAPMLYPTRQKEIQAIDAFLSKNIIRCEDRDAVFDAANICRLGKDLLYLVSSSGNQRGAEWLQSVLPAHNVHVLNNIYSGVHIDSTISPVREGLVVLNADRINQDNVPVPLRSWDKIWITGDDITAQGFAGYPYASNYIGLNFLTVNPNLVICDPKQTYLRTQLEKWSVETIGVELRHSRTLGGGHHCVTLDTVRE